MIFPYTSHRVSCQRVYSGVVGPHLFSGPLLVIALLLFSEDVKDNFPSFDLSVQETKNPKERKALQKFFLLEWDTNLGPPVPWRSGLDRSATTPPPYFVDSFKINCFWIYQLLLGANKQNIKLNLKTHSF